MAATSRRLWRCCLLVVVTCAGVGSVVVESVQKVSGVEEVGREVTGLGSIFDRNLTKCLMTTRLVKCLKLSLLERLKVSEHVRLNTTMDLMDGFVSLEPTVATPGNNTPDVELLEKIGSKDVDVDLLLIAGLTRFFKDKTLKLHFIPGYTVQVHPAKTYSDYVSLTLRQSGETPEQVAARTVKMGSPLMMLGPMITLGMLPFSLASLNYMVMNAYAMNNMALMNVLWTTIRDHVFEEHGEDIVYRNPGYENEFKKYRNRGYANENIKNNKLTPSFYQHGKPIVHEGLKASPNNHGHALLTRHKGPPRPLVHYHQPQRDTAGSHSHVHIKSVTIPAGDKLRLIQRPSVVPSLPRPIAVKLHDGAANFRIHNRGHVLRRPTIPLNHAFTKQNVGNIGESPLRSPLQNGNHHQSSENSYVDEINRIKNIHSSQSILPNVVSHLNQNDIATDGHHAQSQFPTNGHHVNGNGFEIPGDHGGNAFEPVFLHNGQNNFNHQFQTVGSHVNDMFANGLQSNGPRSHGINIGGVVNLGDIGNSPIVVVPNGHHSAGSDGNLNGFRPQGFNAHNLFGEPDSQQVVGSHPHHNHISNDVHLLNAGQQDANVFEGAAPFENRRNAPSYLENHHQGPAEPTSSYSGIQEAHPASVGAEWVPQDDHDASVQNWPIVYIDPTSGQQPASNSGHLETSDNRQADSGFGRTTQSFEDDRRTQSNHRGDKVHDDNGYGVDEDPSTVIDPAISILDAVDLDDKPLSDVGGAQRLVQSRIPQIVQSSVHVDNPFSPIVVPESEAAKKSEQTIGFRQTILPVGPEWKPPQRRNFEHVKEEEKKDVVRLNFTGVVDKTKKSDGNVANRRSDVFAEDDEGNEWKAANNPKFAKQNHRSDADERKVEVDSSTKSSKNIHFGNKGGFGFIVDDAETGWRRSSSRRNNDDNSTSTDIIYDDSHDGNWGMEPGLTEEVIVVENVHDERVLSPRDSEKQTNPPPSR